MIALVFAEQERETSILVSTKHTDYQFVVQVPSLFEGSTTLSRGSSGWSSGQGSSGFPPVPTALCVGHRGGTGWPLFEKVVWFLLPGTPLEQATGSGAARSPEFLAVAMKLRVYPPASTSLSLIPAILFGKGEALCADYYGFMSFCGSEFGLAQYISAFTTSYHLQRIPIFPLRATEHFF